MVTLHFCDHVFRTLDTDGNGYLDFKVDELKLTIDNGDVNVKLWTFLLRES